MKPLPVSFANLENIPTRDLVKEIFRRYDVSLVVVKGDQTARTQNEDTQVWWQGELVDVGELSLYAQYEILQALKPSVADKPPV